MYQDLVIIPDNEGCRLVGECRLLFVRKSIFLLLCVCSSSKFHVDPDNTYLHALVSQSKSILKLLFSCLATRQQV